MTQSEINETARSLGMTPEACPWLWKNTRIRHCINHFSTEQNVRLPDPESDDPAVMLWDGALLRALRWPGVALNNARNLHETWSTNGNWAGIFYGKHETAALLAAWRATQ
jgi:hypothetical protein